jgi:hypothetical protein
LTGIPLVVADSAQFDLAKFYFAEPQGMLRATPIEFPCNNTDKLSDVVFQVTEQLWAYCWVSKLDASNRVKCPDGSTVFDEKSIEVTCITQDDGTPTFPALTTPTCTNVLNSTALQPSTHQASDQNTTTKSFDLLGRKK